MEPTFAATGFHNWKHAIQAFQKHESSQAHKAAVMKHLHEKNSVLAQVSLQAKQEQVTARHCLQTIMRCMQYLARQGLALRGHDACEGNLKQLVYMQAESNESLRSWLGRHQDYTSPSMQNEMLSLMSRTILQNICDDIRKNKPVMFALIVDGTRDICGIEQESVCVRYVSDDIQPVELFLGLYETQSTTGAAIADLALDVLRRLDLPLDNLRGQTYDGAANMSGAYNGAQALIAEKQPLAAFIHCSAHCINLVTEASLSSSPFVRDALGLVNEIGSLSSQSGKFQVILKSTSTSQYGNFASIKPLCPTRWTVRVKAVRHVLDQYEAILEALEEMAAGNGNAATRAAGLLTAFQKGSMLLALEMIVDIVEPLEQLNTDLQARGNTVSGIIKAVQLVKGNLEKKRTVDGFTGLFEKAEKRQKDLDLEVIAAPRIRKPPKRYDV